jgi:signal transduction histidine kinase
LFTLHDLKEGSYRLTARLVDDHGHPPEPVTVEFTLAPPWHRSPLAYVGYVIGTLVAGFGLFFWAIRHTRSRNAFLEQQVRERTAELRSTMILLNDEARNAATLAERNRLAGEIHDSLQQGLSGLMLQLDATLKVPDLTQDVRSKLTVARNMVSFTRHEVQRAVWDLESPLLENADLSEALRKMAGVISSGTPRVEIRTSGTTTELEPAAEHQLLRIAQEAITNAVRHGHARKIFVHLEYSAAEVSLEIFDDGCGFNPKEVFAAGLGHFGLRGLRTRASKINADLQIISAPNRGTTVRVVIPIAAPAPSRHATVATVQAG